MKTGLVELFFFGQLDPSEEADFLAQMEGDPSLQQQFERESALEALFYSMSWRLQSAAAGLENEKHLASLVAPLSVLEKEAVPALFSDAVWKELIDSAMRTAASTRPESAKLFTFPQYVRYLAAACLVAGAGISFGIKSLIQKPVASRTIIVSAVNNQLHETAVKPGTTHVSFVFDTIMIYGSRRSIPSSVSSGRCEGILRLGVKTAVLLEKNASVAVTAQTDSAVSLCLNSGSALFHVEKNRYHRFSIETPACSVAVTGTMFRLSVDFDTTKVSVLEGSVRVKKTNDTSAVSVSAGQSAFFRPDACTTAPGDTAALLLFRSSLLHDFIMENGIWENGRFVRSGMPGNIDNK